MTNRGDKIMASEKRIAANRRNAAKSTGPRTQKGKARSRMNALRHGLAAVLLGSIESDSPNIEQVNARLQQIYAERAKLLREIDRVAGMEATESLEQAIRRLNSLERYDRRAHSKLKKTIK
jgi:hypothetical protein